MREFYQLRARLRPLAAHRRVRQCGALAVAPAVELDVREYDNGERRATWRGVLRCGRQHSCPVCAARRAAERAAELDAMMRGDPLGRWQMLTLTLRHRRGEPLEKLIDRLMSAWRRVRSTRAIRAVFDARVTASVRALEVTWGSNGWHPHLHVLFRTAQWEPGECATLAAIWERVADADREHGAKWSDSFAGEWGAKRAHYLSKLGAELAGIGKEPKRGNMTPWQLAERALGDESARKLWTEYQLAMRGRRILELDERAKALVCEAPLPEVTKLWTCRLYAEEFAALARFERVVPEVVWELADSACSGADPPAVFRAIVDDLLSEDAEYQRSQRIVAARRGPLQVKPSPASLAA